MEGGSRSTAREKAKTTGAIRGRNNGNKAIYQWQHDENLCEVRKRWEEERGGSVTMWEEEGKRLSTPSSQLARLMVKDVVAV
ncbi:hypothetical protein PIB30_070277 [Stylosanthes scabra]|uniref:Uncharacterized protein n=1 Tax=Stylosanthes scabra TaxID=79078 RepID=A0ABU6VLV6_9FABA|nr:hypothetical protein [Stylosanthes scabra]